jgi:hypothetical protein
MVLAFCADANDRASVFLRGVPYLQDIEQDKEIEDADDAQKGSGDTRTDHRAHAL